VRDSQASPPATRSRGALAASYEAGIWRSLCRWVTRRPRSDDPDAALFGYASQVTPLLLAFVFLSALEIPIVSLLLPWPVVRWSLLVVDVWGLLWMLGLLASLRTNPHAVGKAALHLRSGFQFDAFVPWEAISAIRLHRSSAHRKLQIERGQAGPTVALQHTTNIEVILQEPVAVHFLGGHQATVNAIRFYADDPNALLTAIQPAVRSRSAATSTATAAVPTEPYLRRAST
jgi:hypothetical protein